MDRNQLEKHNVGENLDALMNLDPRGYGVCRILYEGSRAAAGKPLAMNAAEKLCETVMPGDAVFILTGFVLLPHKVPEMDGLVSALLLARALVVAFGAKPIIVCPLDCVRAVKKCSSVVGLHIYEDLRQVMELPLSMGVVAFTKESAEAQKQAEALLREVKPSAVVAIEAPGANACGVYHNSVGQDVTDLEAKSDVLWNLLKEQKVLNIAIGDLGNEIGMGSIGKHIETYVPFTAKGECQCKCKGGTLADTTTDHLITATCSDWGCYALMAALAYLKKDMEILHREEMEAEVMRVAARSGMIDMTGSLLPGIDGFNTRMIVGVLSLMRQCTAYTVRYSHQSDHWYAPVREKGFFEKTAAAQPNMAKECQVSP